MRLALAVSTCQKSDTPSLRPLNRPDHHAVSATASLTASFLEHLLLHSWQLKRKPQLITIFCMLFTPAPMMLLVRLAILLLVAASLPGNAAEAASLLKDIGRKDDGLAVQLALQFDRLPAYSVTTAGRRVDVLMKKTTYRDAMAEPEADAVLIKTSTRQRDADTLVSFYFRYPPQKVTPQEDPEKKSLRLDVQTGAPRPAEYPGLTAVAKNPAATKDTAKPDANPKTLSKFAADWDLLFSAYETPVSIKPAPKLHLPAFPLAASLMPEVELATWLPQDIQDLAREGKWNQVLLSVRQLINTQLAEPVKERLLLTYAEALVRAGSYQEPYALAQEIALKYPESTMADLAKLLFLYLGASRGDYFTAYFDFKLLAPRLEGKPCSPYVKMLIAEIALLAGRVADAEILIQSQDASADQALSDLRQLRRADTLYAQDEKTKALDIYATLAQHSRLLATDPLSQANYSDALYSLGRYEEAEKAYQQLSELLINTKLIDLALFRQAMCQLKIPATARQARNSLIQIHEAYVQTEGGQRAWLKETDLDYLGKRIRAKNAATLYQFFAGKAPTVPLREEARLKLAVVQAQAGNHPESVEQAMQLLREFQKGQLRPEAQALLIDQLPGVIKQMVEDKEYVKALVLAKQNKQLFAKGWLDNALLYDLAKAYHQLGLADQTAQTYQYLFEISPEAAREQLYLPFIQAFSSSGQYSQVTDYADRYRQQYPKGKDWPAIFKLKAQALYQSGQSDQALELLNREEKDLNPELELLRARLFYQKNEWEPVMEILSRPEFKPLLEQGDHRFQLAEAYFQTGKDDLAGPLYAQIAEHDPANEQVLYRLAQIELRKNNRAEALNLFKKLAETGKDPLWTKLAREEAAILQIR